MKIPEDPVDRNLLGIEAEKRGAEDTAVAYYEANVRDGFDGSHPYERLAVIYRRRGDYARELEVLEQAIRTLSGRPYSERHVARFSARIEKAKALASGQPIPANRRPAPPGRTNAIGEQVCVVEGCNNPVRNDARRYCDECREIRTAPNVMWPSDHRPEKLFFPVAGSRHHLPSAARVRPGESLYLVRDRDNPYDPTAVEVRREDGELIGYVPRGRELQGKFGYGPYTLLDLAQAMDAGASCTAKCYAAGGHEPGSVQLEGHCSGWLVPYPARIDVWKKRGGGFNRPAEPLPFVVHRSRTAEPVPGLMAEAPTPKPGQSPSTAPASEPAQPMEDAPAIEKVPWWRRDRNDVNTVSVVLNYEGARITAMRTGSTHRARSGVRFVCRHQPRITDELVSSNNDDLYEPTFGQARTRKRTTVAEVMHLVEEGFGSLDEDTLNDAIRALQELRENGRLVGVISHVAELRRQIPARIEVTRGPEGSMARVHPA